MSERIKKLGRELADQYEKGYSVGRKAGLAEARAKIENLPFEKPRPYFRSEDNALYGRAIKDALASLEEGGTSE